VIISAAEGGLAAGYIENLNLIREERERIGRPVLLPPRPGGLAGREELLATLRDRLSGSDGPQPRIAALHGMGGVGKTSVAVEYAHRHNSEFGVVWHFGAEDRIVLEAGFARLSALLAAAGGLVEPQDPVGSVHAVLADSQAPWLLIFDNAPDPVSVREFIPGGGQGQVLITSQHALWPAGQGIEVPMLEVDVAARYLVSRSRDPDLSAARELAADLGGLPLALEQAGAYVEATGISLARYRALFKTRQAELLGRGEPAGHPAGVGATIGVALSRLAGDAIAMGLMRLLACLAPEPVPVRLLLSGDGVEGILDANVAALGQLVGNQLAVGDAVAALRRYSLVTPAEGGMVAAHRLVQAVTLDLMSGEVADAWRGAAEALVEVTIPGDVSLPSTWPVCAVLLPHAFKVLGPGSGGLSRIADFLGFSGDAAAARSIFQAIAAVLQEALGPEHPAALASREHLARWTGHSGDPAGARDLYAGLLPGLERALGAEDPETLTAHANHAHWIGETGDMVGARDMFAALLPDLERVLGTEHPATLSVRGNLARWTGETGDPARARDLYAELASTREQVLGPEDPSTLSARHELAAWTGEAGDPAAARDLMAALLSDMEPVLGTGHPDTLTTWHDLATMAGKAGDQAAARDLMVALLPEMERVLGPTHPETMTARNNLAHWTGETGDAARARDLYAELLPDMEKVLGVQHRETHVVRRQLAYWTQVSDLPGLRNQAGCDSSKP
jgi:hypothetical protein